MSDEGLELALSAALKVLLGIERWEGTLFASRWGDFGLTEAEIDRLDDELAAQAKRTTVRHG